MSAFFLCLVFCGLWAFHFVHAHTGDFLWGFEPPLLDGAPVDSCGNSIRLLPPVDPAVATATDDPAVATATDDPAVATATDDPAVAMATEDPAVATATEDPDVAMATEDPAVAKNKPTPPKPAVQSQPASPSNGPIRPQSLLSFLPDILTQPIRAQQSSSESSEENTASHSAQNSPQMTSLSSEENNRLKPRQWD